MYRNGRGLGIGGYSQGFRVYVRTRVTLKRRVDNDQPNVTISTDQFIWGPGTVESAHAPWRTTAIRQSVGRVARSAWDDLLGRENGDPGGSPGSGRPSPKGH